MRKSVQRSNCLHCQEPLLVRSSREEIPTLRRLILDCTNVKCLARFGGELTITHGISASLNPNPTVDLRMSPPRRPVADNDNLGRQILVSASEVAPPAANDDGSHSEAVATGT
jgi:hypothetical protein